MSEGESQRNRKHASRFADQPAPPRRSLPLSPTLLDQALGGLLVLTTCLLCVFPLTDTDFWWHLRTGQLIVERGTIPRTDWFLFTDSDRPWIDLHWGFQLLIAGLYSLGGVNLVILAKAAVISTAVGLCWFASGRDLPGWVKVLIWIPAVICISGRGFERPEMLSQLFLAMWLWIAFAVERQPRWIWALPAIQVVWINCHALYILGLVVGGCYAMDYFARYAARGQFGLERAPDVLRPQTVLAAGGFCAAAALVNPYGLTGALFPLVLQRKFADERQIYGNIGEFQRPVDFFWRLNLGYENIFLDAQIILAALAFGGLILLFVGFRRWSPFRWLLCLGFGHLAWEATRNVNIFALVFATVTTANAAQLYRLWSAQPEKTVRAKERRREGETDIPMLSHSHTLLPNALTAVLLAVWMVLAVTGVWGTWAGEKKPFALGEQPYWFGHEAAKFAGQPGFPDRAFIAHIGIAATYIYHLGPERKVFLDPRLEVPRPETFLLHGHIVNRMSVGDRRWELMLRDAQKNLPTVILDSRTCRPSINGLLNTPGWRLVFADPAAAVFLSERQADELNLPAADPTPLMYPP